MRLSISSKITPIFPQVVPIIVYSVRTIEVKVFFIRQSHVFPVESVQCKDITSPCNWLFFVLLWYIGALATSKIARVFKYSAFDFLNAVNSYWQGQLVSYLNCRLFPHKTSYIKGSRCCDVSFLFGERFSLRSWVSFRRKIFIIVVWCRPAWREISAGLIPCTEWVRIIAFPLVIRIDFKGILNRRGNGIHSRWENVHVCFCSLWGLNSRSFICFTLL